jgi:hypothetical protein
MITSTLKPLDLVLVATVRPEPRPYPAGFCFRSNTRTRQ